MIDLKNNKMEQVKYKIFWRYSSVQNTRDNMITECVIEKKVGNTSINLAEGRAICKPGDNFSKREGRKRSFNRAVSLIRHDKELRKELWNKFIEMTPKSIKRIK